MGGDSSLGFFVTRGRGGIGIGGFFISSINSVPSFPCLGFFRISLLIISRLRDITRGMGGGVCDLFIISSISLFPCLP